MSAFNYHVLEYARSVFHIVSLAYIRCLGYNHIICAPTWECECRNPLGCGGRGCCLRHWGSVFQTSPSYVLVLACNLLSGKLGEHLTLRKRGEKQVEGAGYLLPPDHSFNSVRPGESEASFKPSH